MTFYHFSLEDPYLKERNELSSASKWGEVPCMTSTKTYINKHGMSQVVMLVKIGIT
ncbi:hypothetical protein ABIC37_004078 [Priestia megaterium]